MNTRARLTLAGAVLLVGAGVSGCGGAPTGASEDDFCAAQTSLLEDLHPDDLTGEGLPSSEDMAEAVEDWAAELEEVGTPTGIPDDARAGFERMVEGAKEIDPSDFDLGRLEELQQGGADASEAVRERAQAFADYVAETCGNPIDDLDLPELPEMQ